MTTAAIPRPEAPLFEFAGYNICEPPLTGI